MKLYNLFNTIILEEVQRRILTENVSEQQVLDALNGMYNVNIEYDDYPDSTPSVAPSKRYIQVYNIGNTKAGNKAIRAYQISGPSKTTTGGAWKIFRLDRIRGWYPTKMKFYKPVSDYGDMPKYNDMLNGQEKSNSPMGKIDNFVNFNKNKTTKPVQKTTVSEPLTPAELAVYNQNRKPQLPKRPVSSYTAQGNPVPGAKQTNNTPIDTSSTTGPKVKKI
jgi:hypothetical protein